MTPQLRSHFQHVRSSTVDGGTAPALRANKSPPPFSLRLSPDERAKLEAAAAGEPLGTYIKGKLFAEDLTAAPRRRRAPVKDHAALAQILGMLGNMRLANNLNQLAKAANVGALPLTPDVEEELGLACAAVFAIRNELMRALGYQGEDST